MKLTAQRHELHPASGWQISRGAVTRQFTTLVVRLEDADGVVAYGESAPVSRYNESISTVETFLAKVDPLRLTFADPVGSTLYLRSLLPDNMAAKCAIDIALLDGAAKRIRKPLYEFLGLGFREGVHTTSFSIGIDTPEAIELKVIAAESFPILKIKLGVAGDAEIFKAVRRAAPYKKIRVDANEGWKTKEQALARIEWLAGMGGVEFIEQPLPAHTPFEDMRWLKERSPLPIFADESFHTAADVTPCAECFHGVNVKLVKTGGLTGGKAALEAARMLGLKTMLGCMLESSVLISAAAQLSELTDYNDLDGNILVTDDPYIGVSSVNGNLSFSNAPELFGIRASPRGA